MNTMTTGIGYYGNPEGNLPVDSISELENYIRDLRLVQMFLCTDLMRDMNGIAM